MAEIGDLVDHEAFELVEHGRVGGIGIDAIGAAGRDDADRRLLVQHRAHLHGAGMRAQHMARAVGLFLQIEGVVHLPRGMIRRDVELGEIVIVEFDIGAFGDGEAQIGEDRGHFVEHLG